MKLLRTCITKTAILMITLQLFTTNLECLDHTINLKPEIQNSLDKIAQLSGALSQLSAEVTNILHTSTVRSRQTNVVLGIGIISFYLGIKILQTTAAPSSFNYHAKSWFGNINYYNKPEQTEYKPTDYDKYRFLLGTTTGICCTFFGLICVFRCSQLVERFG